MAKAASPIRLERDLMKAAETTAARFHRSTAEQIEYWAELGRSVSSTLDPNVLLSIMSGLARLNVEPVVGEPIDPDDVFASLDQQRESGHLQRSITDAPLQYQASTSHPGLLEQRDQNGNITIGQFKDGEFVRLEDSAS